MIQLNEKAEIHVWGILKPSPERLALAFNDLPLDEQQKSKRFSNLEHGLWWGYVHTAQRDILSRYLNCKSLEIEFEYSSTGKPSLTNKHKSNLEFNLTHCSDSALLAIGKGMDIGIDIEAIKEISDVNILVKHFFSDVEQRYYFAQPDRYRLEVFYHIWTRKESLIKAIGVGLSAPLEEIDVVSNLEEQWSESTSSYVKKYFGKYLITSLCLSEFGLSLSHKAALSMDAHLYKLDEELPALKLITF